MRYTEYGSTGKKVSALGFGAMRFAEPEKIDEMAEVVTHAYNRGINYLDTAPGYCDDKSEYIIGAAIKEIRRSDSSLPWYVSSKSNKVSGDDLRRDLEESLRRLDVDAIDFYHCWYLLRPGEIDTRIAGGAIAAMQRAKEEGLIRHMTFSTHLPGEEIVKVIERDLFDGVLLGYSAANYEYRQEGIQAAYEKGLGVVNMNSLGGGTIVQNEQAFSYLKVHEGQSILDAAIHFLLQDERINVRLIGFRDTMDVDSAIDSFDRYQEYTREDMTRIHNGSHEEYNRLCTACKYCDVCPVDIPVWKFVETANSLYLKTDEDISGRLKYYWGANIEQLDTCIECRKCERACTQRIPILDRFEELKEALQRKQV